MSFESSTSPQSSPRTFELREDDRNSLRLSDLVSSDQKRFTVCWELGPISPCCHVSVFVCMQADAIGYSLSLTFKSCISHEAPLASDRCWPSPFQLINLCFSSCTRTDFGINWYVQPFIPTGCNLCFRGVFDVQIGHERQRVHAIVGAAVRRPSSGSCNVVFTGRMTLHCVCESAIKSSSHMVDVVHAGQEKNCIARWKLLRHTAHGVLNEPPTYCILRHHLLGFAHSLFAFRIYRDDDIGTKSLISHVIMIAVLYP